MDHTRQLCLFVNMYIVFKINVVAYTCESDVNGLFDPLHLIHHLSCICGKADMVWHDGGA